MGQARILLVDDDPDAFVEIREVLGARHLQDWSLAYASTFEEGLDGLSREPFDAALIDYYLGVRTGLDFISEAQQRGISTPLILLTGIDDRAVDLAATEVGACDFLQKNGLTTEGLDRALRYAVRHGKTLRLIRDRELHFRALIQHSSDGVLLVDEDARVSFASDSFSPLVGLPPTDVAGGNFLDLVHPGDRTKVERQIAEAGRHATTARVEFRVRHVLGSWRHAEAMIVNRLSDAAVRAVVLNCRDVTDRKLAEAQRDHLASIVESSQDAIVGKSLSGIIVSWNAAAERLYGYSADEVVGRSASVLLPPESVGEYLALLREVSLGNRIQPFEGVRVRRDGSRLVVSLTFSPIRNADGTVIGASSVARDITGQLEAQRLIAERERQYRSLFEDSPAGLAHVTVQGSWRQANAQFCDTVGFSLEDLQQLTLAELLHPEDEDATIAACREMIQGARESYDAEQRLAHNRGGHVWARLRIRIYRAASGEAQHFVVAVTDITARRNAEEQLRETIARLQAILRNLPLAIWVLNPDGVITFTDGLLLSRFGVSPGELVGTSQLELYASEPQVLEPTRRALNGEHVYNAVQVQGGIFDTWYTPLRDDEGRFIGTIGISMDVTERVRVEEQLRQAQKMEAIGQLAGGIAHDFNNLLTAILGFNQLAKEALPDTAPARKDLEEVEAAGKTAAAMARQLLTFSRRQTVQIAVLDVNAVVSRMEALLRRLIGETIGITTILRGDIAPVSADSGQIEQVIMNLVINARDAMPGGGSLVLETADVVLGRPRAGEIDNLPAGRYTCLTVADTGTGIDDAARKHLFEPFFTTKGRKGTGLGLATAYGIVKQAGGAITVESHLGHGSAFTVWLPATSNATTEVVDVRPAADLRGTETILVVEDQAEVKTLAVETLMRSGYRVFAAATPHAAVDLAERFADAIDLVFTDVIMPEMRGPELVQRLEERIPDLRVLYTSGYVDGALDETYVVADDVMFLAKPYGSIELLTKIREVLDKPARSRLAS